ncbi:MAG: 16S rRNA (uracil(1498)-N(3))-methyltransferase [Candidatus Marinimicrobia bacterium]|nr:16S rRNA (uracil(1498)-N(3))-methyltransferase [Candidatus Neomarinimicrobiota bacterium]
MHEYNFFVPPENQSEQYVYIEGGEYKHCCNVLRKSEGAKVSVFDGKGNRKDVKLLEEKDNSIKARIIKDYPQDEKVYPNISLGVGIVRNKAMKMIIAQATSLGIDEFYPVKMKNCIKYNFRRNKFVRKSIQAAKQSGNSHLPKIGNTLNLEEWLNMNQNKDLKLLAWQDGDKSFSQICQQNPNAKDIVVMIGPEGGLHNDELEAAKATGFIPVNLFPYRLRTELATTNMLSGIYHLYN